MLEQKTKHGGATEYGTEVPRSVRPRQYDAVADRASMEWSLWNLCETLRGTSVVNLSHSLVNLSRIALLLLFTHPLTAQPLDSLRQLLRENNPQLQALAYEYRAQSTIGRQEAQLMDLQISGGVSPMPVETRLGPQIARVGLLQMFPWPGTLAAMSNLANARAQPLLEEAAALQLELLYELETTYYRVAEAEATIATVETSLDLFETLREIALRRVENSRGSSVDVYRIELETNAARRDIRSLETETALAWTRIEELVNTRLPRVLIVPA
ncbi:MAG: TolC family protein, partial [Lewinella sp.]